MPGAVGNTALASPSTATGPKHPYSHARSDSVQSSSSAADEAETASAEDKTSSYSDMIRRDMEFFRARLTRTTSGQSAA